VSDDLARTPLYEEHVALGARMVPFAGYSMPVQYGGITEEHNAVRREAGLFDVSHMGRLELEGQYAFDVVNYLVTNDLGRIQDGQAMYTVACKADGTILDDLIVYRRSRTSILVVCNASNRPKMMGHFAQASRDHCEFRDLSERLALIALQGPRSFELCARAGGADLAAIAGFHLRSGRLAGVEVTAARTGYTGEDGLELFCATGDAPRLWRALLSAGARPAGLGARDTLRLEARLCLYGNDIDETTTPLEAGLGWVVKLEKGDFIGRAALEQQKVAGLSRKLVGFEMVGRGIARHGYPITAPSGGPPLGTVTSGGPSITLGKNIGLGYVPTALSTNGTSLGIEIRGKTVEATVVKTPFYKRATPGNDHV
jgi:glycine cleavage system T protein (aminomethyltransferase)